MKPLDISAKTRTLYAKDLPSRDALLLALHEQEKAMAALQAELQSQLEQSVEVIQNKDQTISVLQEQLRLAIAQRFGKSSEKSDPNQGQLFNEAELLADNLEPDDELEPEDGDEPKKKSKGRKGRKGIDPNLPRVRVEILLTGEQRAGAIDTFFTRVKEELHIVPAKAYVNEIWQEKAVFEHNGTRQIVVAERPRHPLGKCMASVELLAWIITAKYADGLPLYRLESILKRCSADITRTAMAHWVIRLSEQLLALLKVLHDHQLRANYLQGDETRIQVLKEPGKDPTGKKQMWVLRGGPPDRPVVTFHYDATRAGAVVRRLLDGYEGEYFQCDGYSAYVKPCAEKNVTLIGCWDHARRKFKEAEKAIPKSKKSQAPAKCTVALSLINKLYRIERGTKDLTDDEKFEQRQEQSLPVLAKLHAWLEKNKDKVQWDGLTGKAIRYTLNQWPKLIGYTKSGELCISNVRAENAIRPFVIGRKAWMFADTPKGAHASACFYTLIETAKANDVEPYRYLAHVIGRIADAETVEDLEYLLPWNMS